jgi:signal transduction histidine kinase
MELGHISQEEVPERLVQMKQEVHRARDIIDSLLGFVRPREATVGDVDILALVNEALNLLANEAKLNHINIESQLAQVPPIQGNATTLKQVFFNILRNAIEAMPAGGRLRVSTAVDNVDLRVEIQDTGAGIPAEYKSRIFEPFFTTKEAGYGTGLGLAISYAIVNDHRGDIKVISEVGKGSTFIVTLPIGE